MRCLINQPAGLGDIIFCQKIVDVLINNGYEVIWPVGDEYCSTVNKHMRKDNLLFPHVDDNFPLKQHYNSGTIVPYRMPNGDTYLPLRYADLSYPGQSALKAKFKIMGIDHLQWQHHFRFYRDVEKEERLFYDALKLKDDTQYAFVNMWYGSPPGQVKKNTDIDTDLLTVEMSIKEDYSVFDWCKVIEQASELYCVDTSLFYIIEQLQLKASKFEAYSKFSPSNYMHIDGLFAKPWNYN